MKILVVDDTKQDRYLLQKLLEGCGYNVDTASDGVEAIEKARESLPDMIITDVLMPKMDGFQLCRTLKSDEELKDIPVLFYSATYTDKKSRELAFGVGAVEYIAKPIEPGEFIKIIRETSEKYGGGELKPPANPLEEQVYMKMYNEQLVRKLEAKVVELKMSEARYRSVVESVDDLIYLIDRANRFLSFNTKPLERFGMTPEEVIGREVSEIISDPVTAGFSMQMVRKVIETERSVSYERELDFMGHRRWYSTTMAPVFDADGFVIAAACIGRDVTDRRLAEARIEHLNSVLAAIRNVNQVIVTEKDRDSLLQKSCDAMVEAWGYDAAWIGFLQDGENFVAVKGSGFREDISRFCEDVMSGTHPSCIRNALAQNDIFVVVDRSKECGDCPLNSECTGREVAVIRIEHTGRLFGLLVVSLVMQCWHYQDRTSTPSALADVTADEEEEDLLKGVASDIALGLYDIEVEEAQRAAEEALHQSEIRFRTLVEHLPTITYTAAIDEMSTILYVSPQTENILGISPEEYKADPDFWLKHLHDEDRERVLKEFNDAHETGMPLISEYRMITTDGRIVWLRDEAVIIKDERGKPLYLQGIMLDITERKLDEEKLLESEEHYQRMVANVPGMVYQLVLHPDGSMAFPFVSERCRELFGMAPHELMQDANLLLDIVHPDAKVAFYRSIADSAKSLSPWDWEGRCVVSGEERWFRCISRPEQQANGDTLWDGLITDITERKLAEKRITEEYHRAEFYIDLMSHDINNLSQVTSGHLELLLRMPELSSKSRKHAETALDHVRKSADIISNVKTISKVHSGELEIGKIDIYPAFASAVETAKSQPRDVRINSNITEGRYFIRGNALLFDVFSNLLNNAIKFDGHDIVEIDVGISSSGDDWAIEFKDRGRGIGHDYKKVIFNRMEMAGESTQGSGLGLTIVKYIVLSYGGKIWVEDRVRGDRTQGSNFIVLLPNGD